MSSAFRIDSITRCAKASAMVGITGYVFVRIGDAEDSFVDVICYGECSNYDTVMSIHHSVCV